uniref:PS2 n=1 Tax=Corynebacterium glutamicum TaxID=1718 RepID=Q6QUT7_CORGT|nr:PS2 [Corynebacterium glutamicum]
MFNNRIRTAALAGAIAISTAASGVAIPAFAQETPVTTNGFNDADGSTIQPAPAVNHTEAELRDATDATGDYLADFQEGDLEAIVGELIAATENGFDPSEEAAYETFKAARERATQQLAFSAETITKTRESVAYALKVDQEATEAYLAYRNALRGAATSINPLINAANAANRTDKSEVEEYDNIFLASDVFTDAPAPLLLPAYKELVALQAEVNEDLEWLGEFAIDNDPENYVQRYHIPAVEALKAEIDARLEAIEPLRADSAEKNRIAQKSDVLVRQLFLERATAQRDTLRVLEAIFSTVTRYVELYESAENGNAGDVTLRARYIALVPSLLEAAYFNISHLNVADQAVNDYYLVFSTDLETNDEDAAYAQEKFEFAVTTYAKILLNGKWQEDVKFVQNLDDEARAEAARVEAERAADEAYRAEQLRIAQEAADAQKAIADALAKEAENGNNNGGDNSSDDKPAGSSDIGSWGPFAAIAAIIAAIAAIFPFLSGIVKF